MGLPEGQAPFNVLTDGERAEGGKSLSPLKVLANSMRRRKYCSVQCSFADMCPVLPLSMSKEEMLPNGKQPCKMKSAPQSMQRRIQNMFLNGEEGLLLEIKQSLFVVSTHLGDDNKERMQYADSLMKLHKSIYGEKSQLTSSPEPLEITVRQLNVRSGDAQEIKIGKKPQEIRQANAAAILSRNDPPQEPIDLDPESLLTSPILETIIHRKKDDDETRV
jgi:hypothetical protein